MDLELLSSQLAGVGFAFDEPMYGWFARGETDPAAGERRGQADNTQLRFDVRIRAADLERFIRLPEHRAELTGTVSGGMIGGTFPIRDGLFELFSVDPPTGFRRMVYRFRFTGAGGAEYLFHGQKEIRHERGRLDVVEDMTRLYSRIYAGSDDRAPVWGAGVLVFHPSDAPALVASMTVEGARSWTQEVAARAVFTSFLWGELREEYLKDLSPLYRARYDNLVLAGRLTSGEEFFFVSGVHDKGFPWGDGESFWDVLLVVSTGSNGWRRFLITDRVLAGLTLEAAHGQYRYQGPLYELSEGYRASFRQIERAAPHLNALDARIEIDFEIRSSTAVPFPFPKLDATLRRLSSDLARRIEAALPAEAPLGIFITPHVARVLAGTLSLGATTLTIDPVRTLGEFEHGSFHNVREPTLLYNYLCAVEPPLDRVRIQIASRTLRNERTDWAKDQLDRWIGLAVSRQASAEIRLDAAGLNVRPLARAQGTGEVPFRKTGEPLLEATNDHYPTAAFERRIVAVEDGEGASALALEEDMTWLRREAIGSTRQERVACFSGADKFAALERVLAESGFDPRLEARLAASGKARSAFRIVIKPNFMFAYDKRDRSTYTDPDLVAALVRHLVTRGFSRIQVAEAHSTYGEFFDHRTVREMAAYLGYDPGAGYEIVDLTLDGHETRHLGPHLGSHPVPLAWRDADFRISFAKNKTHAYAYFTLTLKNIYGALPLANKFKEYHCRRDIYHTTIEYLRAFPVDYGLIDAWLSADGPFGVFADPAPNETRSIIGGTDLVAVDWVGASKMGIDPTISPYVQLAVEAFGKPEIEFAGDASVYQPWLNVPAAVTTLAHGVMDANHYFGNLLYSVSAQMDSTHFHYKDNSLGTRLLRRMTDPLRQAVFVRTGENPSWSNRALSWILYQLSR